MGFHDASVHSILLLSLIGSSSLLVVVMAHPLQLARLGLSACRALSGMGSFVLLRWRLRHGVIPALPREPAQVGVPQYAVTLAFFRVVADGRRRPWPVTKMDNRG
jgi:hypothetical protein